MNETSIKYPSSSSNGYAIKQTTHLYPMINQCNNLIIYSEKLLTLNKNCTILIYK